MKSPRARYYFLSKDEFSSINKKIYGKLASHPLFRTSIDNLLDFFSPIRPFSSIPIVPRMMKRTQTRINKEKRPTKYERYIKCGGKHY